MTDRTTPKPLSVSEITRRIKETLEGGFAGVWIEGEISQIARPRSGHIYLTLKDSRSQIRGVIWRSTASRIRFDLDVGLEIVVQGNVTVYAPRGDYQVTVSRIEPKGVGALQLAFQQLLEKLTREGLFEAERKKPLPYLPRRIGLVTSPTGAAVRDILNVIDRRFPKVHILIDPVQVQGGTAAPEIAAAIDAFNRRGDVEVLIVGRGGGSPEDLWAFNEEVVARAIHRSSIPVISAVGHEVDVTISDLVADRRALTPTEAAEIVLPKESDLRAALSTMADRLMGALRGRATLERERLRQIEKGYAFRMPQERIRQLQQSLDEKGETLRRTIRSLLEISRERLRSVAGRLETLSPLAVLGRGYSLTLPEGGGPPIRDAGDLEAGASVETRLARGSLISRITEVRGPEEQFRLENEGPTV